MSACFSEAACERREPFMNSDARANREVLVLDALEGVLRRVLESEDMMEEVTKEVAEKQDVV